MRVLVVLTAYDPALPGTRTLYLTNGTAFTTGAGETPASQTFDPVLVQPLDIARKVQGVGRAARASFGELRVANGDGAYDAWAGYAFDGRAIEVRLGPDAGAYPSDYPVQWSGTMDRVDVTRDTITIRVRDRLAELDTPLLTDRFAGDNVPPDGLEGGDELKDRVKPRVYGAAKDVPLIPVNASRLIYLASDNESDVFEVRDSGVPLGLTFSLANAGIAGNPGVSYIAYGGGRFMAGSSGTVYHSADGSTWSTASFPGGFSARCALGDGDGVSVSRTYVFGGNNGEYYLTSDFSSWSAGASSGFGTDPITKMAVGRSSSLATNFAGISSVGLKVVGNMGSFPTTYTAASTPVDICWSDDLFLFCVVGDTGLILTSADGVTWTTRTSGTTANLRCVNWGNGVFVAVGLGATILTSPDGIRWSASDAPTTSDLNAATFNGSWHIIGCETTGNPLFRSRDGVLWQPIGEDRAVTSLTASPVRLAAISDFASGSKVLASAPATTYADATELEDDSLAPAPGNYGVLSSASGTYVRLGAQPFGDLRADVTQGATAADRTAAQLFADVLTDAGYTSADWVAGDLTALDTADNAELGVYLDGPDTISEVLDGIAGTVGAWWGVDADGDFRIQQLTAPSGTSTFDVTEYDTIRLERVASSDPLLGLPSYRTTLRYAFGATQLLDGTATATDTGVLTTHLLAQDTTEDTLYVTQADAAAEATRRQTLRGVQRSAFLATVPLVAPDGTPTAFASLELGQVGTLTHPRFGLDAGVLVRVLGLQPDLRAKTITLTLWR